MTNERLPPLPRLQRPKRSHIQNYLPFPFLGFGLAFAPAIAETDETVRGISSVYLKRRRKVFYSEQASWNLIHMRRPKWLSGWGKGKNPFESSLIIDILDIKVVEASFSKKLVLFAVGTSQQPKTAFSGGGGAEGMAAKHGTQKDLEWKIFYDRSALPDFIPSDKAMDFMAGTVAVSSGSESVYDAGTMYIASSDRPTKGNAPVLLDYEMAKKIEEARKKK